MRCRSAALTSVRCATATSSSLPTLPPPTRSAASLARILIALPASPHRVTSRPHLSCHFHTARPRLHGGRHHHEEEDEHEHDLTTTASHTTPVTPADRLLMQSECTKITMQGVYCNVALALLKFGGGVFGNSMAMIADAVHSLSDLLTDGITLWASRLTHKPRDADHPYGHGKFEAVGSLTISLTLAATAAGIGWSAVESIRVILAGDPLDVPTGVALFAAVVSIAVKEVLYHATMRVGQKWNSKVIKANAWHHRSDSVSTLVAMVGVVGAMIKLPILDPMAGIFVSGLILKAALELGWDALRDLTDENVDARTQADVARVLVAMKPEGVLSFHRLRGRTMGPFVLMDVHISVDPTISVSAAHQIAERARIKVRQRVPIIAEFSVHVDVAAESEQHGSLFEDVKEEDLAPAGGVWAGEVQVFTERHIAEVVREYRASRAQTLKFMQQATDDATTSNAQKPLPHQPSSDPKLDTITASASNAPAESSTAASSDPTPKSKLVSSLKKIVDIAAPSSKKELPVPPSALPATEGGATSAAANKAAATVAASSVIPPPPGIGTTATPPQHRTMDLSQLMRPQSLIERDVRKVLSDPHATYAPFLRGVSHFTCHWSAAAQRLRVQLELVFHNASTLTIDQASIIGKQIEARILQEVRDVHAVDIHLELTDAHVRSAKQTDAAPLELPKTTTGGQLTE